MVEIEPLQLLDVALTVVGAGTIALNAFAHLTKNKVDDKILAFLRKLLAAISLNVDERTVKVEGSVFDLSLKLKR